MKENSQRLVFANLAERMNQPEEITDKQLTTP